MDSDQTPSTRVRRFVLTNRWPVAVGVAVTATAFVAGFLIGLAPGLTAALAIVVVAAGVAWPAWRDHSRGGDEPGGLGAVVGNLAVITMIIFGIIQLVPYGRDHSNPPVSGEPAWSSPRTRELMVTACYGCHSNEVEWPWYSSIAPLSWAVTGHVDEGRDEVNYSEFATSREGDDDTIEVILEGSMPPGYYTRFGLHSAADLSEAEISELVAGLRATPGFAEEEDDEDDEDEEEDDD